MATIDVTHLTNRQINQAIREEEGDCQLTGCLGQRFIGSGMTGCSIGIEGIPGNALGAYLDGAMIEVFGNAQDAVGDTMNEGSIVVHGNIGDTAGYAMRGGEIYVQENAGYRAGIHMKEYGDKRPVMVIGGCTGSFLGEYQAGGLIVVLGLNRKPDQPIVSHFPCTGMHGGKVILRASLEGITLPDQVETRNPNAADLADIEACICRYCMYFGGNTREILDSAFTVITPLSHNPYQKLYAAN